MRSLRLFAGLLVGSTLLAGTVRADPLACVPEQAQLVLKVESPRKLVETVNALDAYKQLQKLAPLQEFFDSTTVRRFEQLVAYYERELGAKWPELLDRVAGNGIVLAVKYGEEPNPTLLVVEARDEAALARFVELGTKFLEEDIARQDSKTKVEKLTRDGVEIIRVGKDLHAARVGSRLLVGSQEKVLDAGLKMALAKGADRPKSVADNPKVADARKLLPPAPLGWLWFDLAVAHNAPEAKELFATPRNDAVQTIAFGSWIDVVGKAPFVTAGFYGDKTGFRTTVRFPAGREELPEGRALHVPPGDGPGTLPPLTPKGVMYSQSWYFDFSALYDKRDKLFPPMIAKQFEEGEKAASRFLPGTTLAKLYQQSGARHRFVAVNQADYGYKIEPGQRIPAMALVTTMRDPQFGKSMEAVIRAGALLGGAQVSLKLVEEKVGDVTLVGYRFPEDGKFPADPQNLRFNFTPCFATVEDQFMVCSTIELGRELIKELKAKPAKSELARDGRSAAMRIEFHAAGGADYFKTTEDQLLTQTILDQAIPIGEAKKQVAELITYLRQLGTFYIETDYGDKAFRVDLGWKMK